MSPLDPWDPLTDEWKYIVETHITDWPEECLEVLSLASSLCSPREIGLMLNIPLERVFAWFDFGRTRIFGPPPDGIPPPEPLNACDDWTWAHRRCCSKEMFEAVNGKYYVLAELHGIDQPNEKTRKLFESIRSAEDVPERRDVPGPSQRRRRDRGRRT